MPVHFPQVFTILLWITSWTDLGRGLWEWTQKENVSYAALLSPFVVGLGMVCNAAVSSNRCASQYIVEVSV